VTLRRQAQPAAPIESLLGQRRPPDQRSYLAISRDGQILFTRVRHARQFFSRLRGLLLTQPMQPEDGLLLSPCSQIHTIGMAYPIDILFLDQAGRVLRCVSEVGPYRAKSSPGAAHTLEVAAGRIRHLHLRPGQLLTWAPAARFEGQW